MACAAGNAAGASRSQPPQARPATSKESAAKPAASPKKKCAYAARTGEVVAEDTAILNEDHDEGGGGKREKRDEFCDQDSARGIGRRVVNKSGCEEERTDDLAEEVVKPGEEKEGPANAQTMRPDEDPVEIAFVGRSGLRQARSDAGGGGPLIVRCRLQLRLHRDSFTRAKIHLPRRVVQKRYPTA